MTRAPIPSILAILAILAVLSGCGQPKPVAADPISTSPPASSTSEEAATAPAMACVEATDDLNFGGPKWAGGELCLDDRAVAGKQVILGLLGNGKYDCRGTGCALDIAFGKGPFHKFKVRDTDVAGGVRGGLPDVVYVLDRQAFEKGFTTDPVVSIRVPMKGLGRGVFRFDTRNMNAQRPSPETVELFDKMFPR